LQQSGRTFFFVPSKPLCIEFFDDELRQRTRQYM
jgi:hypothetical protein